MTLPTDPGTPPRRWSARRRWIAIGASAAVVAAVVVIVAVSSHDDNNSGASITAGSIAVTDSTPTTIGSTSVGDVTTSAASVEPGTTSPVSTTGAAATSTLPTTTASAASTSTSASSPSTTAAPPPLIPLGAAESLAVLGNTGVTSAGATEVNGQIGASNGAVSGFTTAGPSGVIIVSPEAAGQAQLSAGSAVEQLDALSGASMPGGFDPAIAPGIYDAADIALSGTITLDAGTDPNALFVFRADAMTVADNTRFVLQGGALACQVFWRISSSATLGAGSDLSGTLIAGDSITVGNATNVVGRLIARNGAVTLDGDSIGLPACA